MHLFFDLEPPISKLLYGWSGINGNFLLSFLLFSFVISTRLNIFVCLIIAALKKIKSHPDAVDYFKEIPFNNKHIEKRKIKRLRNMLSKLPYYNELNVIKTNHAFIGYVMSYKVELIEKKSN